MTEFKYQHCYFNDRNKNAFLVVAKDSTVAWGKTMVIEGIGPGQDVQLYAVSLGFPQVDWHEITRDEFERLSGEYRNQYIDKRNADLAALNERRKSGLRGKVMSFFERKPKLPVELRMVKS